MIRQESDTGVSPVVGIILMVAVTVALVALAANFVFNIGGESSSSAAATVDFSEDSNGVEAQLLKNENADSIKVVNQSSGASNSMSSAGDIVSFADNGGGHDYTVIAVLDGEEQVLQTYTSE